YLGMSAPSKCPENRRPRTRNLPAEPLNLARFLLLGWLVAARAHGTVDALDQLFAIEWLTQESHGAAFERARSDRLFGEGGNEDDRQLAPVGAQPVLQIDAGRSRHLYVRNDAPGIVQMLGVQEIVRRREDQRAIAVRLHQPAGR